MASALCIALGLAEGGTPVFPCLEDKRPACPHGFKDASTDKAEIRNLWRRFPGPLVGHVTGEPSGIDVLDIDFRNGAGPWWEANKDRLMASAGSFLGPYHGIRTRGGGLHFFFHHVPGLRCSQSKVAPGIDVKADGGYVVWWADPYKGLPLADWPDWLLEELRSTGGESDCEPLPPTGPQVSCADRYAAAALRSACERIAGAVNGKQEHVLNSESLSIGRLVGRGLIGEADALRAMVQAGMAMSCGDPRRPWTHRCVTEKVRRGLRDGAR
jgi:Bifunctional DNA primase/polymerase, N-terminal